MQYRRSIFLINRAFQLRFAFYVCSWLFALSIAYPAIIYTLFDAFIDYAARNPGAPSPAALQQTRWEIIWLLVLLHVIFLTVTFLISIFMSHKIAGPLYKLMKFFEAGRTGELNGPLFFRTKDHFPELAEGFNEMVGAMHDRVAKVSGPISRLEKAAAKASPDVRSELEAAIAELKEVQKSAVPSVADPGATVQSASAPAQA